MSIWYKVSFQDKTIQAFHVDSVKVLNEGYPSFEAKEWIVYRYVNYLQEEKVTSEKRYSDVHLWCPDIASARQEVLKIVEQQVNKAFVAYNTALKQAKGWENAIDSWSE